MAPKKAGRSPRKVTPSNFSPLNEDDDDDDGDYDIMDYIFL